MPYTKLALYSIFFTAVGTIAALLLAWYTVGPGVPSSTMLLVSMIGAVIGSYTGWRHVSHQFDFEALDAKKLTWPRKQQRYPHLVS